MTDQMLAHVNSLMLQHPGDDTCFSPDSPEIENHIRSLAKGIDYMNHAIRTSEFPSVADEVRYFKEVQPLLVKEYIFFTSLQQF